MSHYSYIFGAVVIAALFSPFANSTVVNDEKEIWCARANITGVRIEGCEKEPCTLKKGDRLPIEIDFSFQKPKSTNDINFQVFVSYWNVPGTGAYGSYIAKGNTCKELKLKSCPAVSNRKYTLKSHLYADPRLESTLGKGSTGEVRTSWTLTPSDRTKDGYSTCSFNVRINLTDDETNE